MTTLLFYTILIAVTVSLGALVLGVPTWIGLLLSGGSLGVIVGVTVVLLFRKEHRGTPKDFEIREGFVVSEDGRLIHIPAMTIEASPKEVLKIDLPMDIQEGLDRGELSNEQMVELLLVTGNEEGAKDIADE